MSIKNLTRESFKWKNGRGHDQKPILYSVKNNNLGLGTSAHVAQTDNWWERAFDNSLKSLTVNETPTGEISVVQGEVKGGGVGLSEVIKGMKGRGGLTLGIKFVKGGLLEGSIGEKELAETKKGLAASLVREEKSEVKAEPSEESKKERKLRRRKEKEERALRKAARQERRERKLARRKAQEKKKSKDTLPTPPSSGEEEEEEETVKPRKKKSSSSSKKSSKSKLKSASSSTKKSKSKSTST
ncbi:hypothetical protein DFH27DRAFT_101822 [Peziza echinospora]|nr:hypothetical protein DFH27DRAFT_101822 [Peziza echinospora]